MNALRKSAWLARMALTLGLLIVAPAHAADCYRTDETCVEGPETRDIGGYPVTRECWRYRASYSCISQESTDDCAPLRERGCSQIDSSCMETSAEGACTLYEQTWQCRITTGTSSTVTNCGGQQFCLDGRCFDTGHAPDADFARAVAGLEAAREAGHYLDPDTLEVFTGYDNRCRKKLFGLANCCTGGGTGGSLFSTMSLISGAGGAALGAMGSSYTYDGLFTADTPDLALSGFESLFSAGGGSSALSALMGGNLSVSSFISSLVPGPWSLAMLAIELSGLLSCEDDEQVLALKRDNRLCHSVGSYCSAKLPIIGTCIEVTRSYCCFNSRLSRILNEQGRAQLTRGWGSPKSPDCRGMSLAELQGLDFSRMDLSEFYAEIAPTLPELGTLQERAREKLESSFGP